MTGDQKAERFIQALIFTVAISLLLTFQEAYAAGRHFADLGLVFAFVWNGAFCWFLLKRKRIARIVFGVFLLLPAALSLTLLLTGAEAVSALDLIRHLILGAFGGGLLFWQPLRDYTRGTKNA